MLSAANGRYGMKKRKKANPNPNGNRAERRAAEKLKKKANYSYFG